MMRLKRLIRDIHEVEVKGSKEIDITGICSHSKLVAPGNLFIVKKGLKHDGSQFIADAVAAGAACILTDIYNPFLPITQIIHPDINKIEALLAAEYFQHPSRQLNIVGVTGTSGKTTTTYLIKHILEDHRQKTGLIGTLGCILGDHHFPIHLTTPDVVTNHKLLKEMVNGECQHVAMEVSSHALEQRRVEEIDFKIGVFTNLTPEHLDYHHTMENYAVAKMKLFSSLSEEKHAVINRDDPLFSAISSSTKAKIFSYGLHEAADLRGENIILTEHGLKFTACFAGEKVAISSSLIGRFNVYNLLAALASCYLLGLSLEDAAKSLKRLIQVPGRLMRIPNKLGISIFVDYAHKQDALRNVLECLKEIKHEKMITVFGCGGDRDRQKREKMGKIASEYSDRVIITNDNPRSEDPQMIIQQILQGIPADFPVEVLFDRKEAIEYAIAIAKSGDIVLIAGKGHETTQIFAQNIFSFDDAEIAKQVCLQKEKLLAVH